MSSVLAGSTLNIVTVRGWSSQMMMGEPYSEAGQEKTAQTAVETGLKIAARILLNSCRGMYTFDRHLLTDNTTADAQALCTQCGCYLAFHPPGMHTNAHTVAHAWANAHTCTLMFIYLEINEGFHPLIRSIKSSCQRGHAVIIVQRMMVMWTWFCPWHWNVKHVKNLQTV